MHTTDELLSDGIRTRTLSLSHTQTWPRADLTISSGTGLEERSDLTAWRAIEAEGCRIARITGDSPDACLVHTGETLAALELRNDGSLRHLLAVRDVVIDISGLPLRVWAPLVRTAIKHCDRLRVVYAEPQEYKAHKSPTPEMLFDLSERFLAISPVPGFAKLTGPARDVNSLLVVLLGFEGGRAGHIASNFDPEPPVVPVVGAPGMMLEYPTQSLVCNRLFLGEAENPVIHTADAVCPFQALRLLRALAEEHEQPYMYVSPLGTKPHALGAVLFANERWEMTELVYDHPVPREASTAGVGAIYEYSVKP